MQYFTKENHLGLTKRLLVPVLFTLVCSSLSLQAQNVLSTASTLSVNNGSGGISFNVSAKRDVAITEIQNVFAEFNQSYTIWYSKDSIQGSPFISSVAGWSPVQTGSLIGDALTPKSVMLSAPIIMRAGETFGFYIEGNTRFMTASVSPFVFADDNLIINTGQDVGYGGAISPSIAARQFVGAIVYTPLIKKQDDAGVTAFPSTIFCSGSQNIQATVRNLGSSQLNSIQVNWSVNGISQTPVSYATLIDTFNGGSNYEITISLGNWSFANGQVYSFKIWTSSPNGNIDPDHSNDTLSLTLKTALSGNYTIGGTSPDYATISDAILDVHLSGVCGPTSFFIRNGNYFEQMNFEIIKGASATNTIEFIGENKNNVVVRHSGVSGNPATVFLRGTRYLSIKNLTISNLGIGNSVGIQFMNKASYNTIDDNIILLDTNISSPSSTSCAITASSSTTSVTGYGENAYHNTIKNNKIYGGYYGIRWNGISASDFNDGNSFINNEVSKFYYYGIYMLYQSGGLIESNLVASGTYSYGYNIYLSNCIEMTINANRIPVIMSYGLYISAMNKGYSTSSLVSNNMIGKNSISTGTPYAIYCTNVYNTDIVHNTSVTQSGYPIYIPSSSSSTSGNLRVNNNIFSNTSGVALNAGSSSVFNTLDYNIYYTQGTNLVTIGTGFSSIAAAQVAYPALNANSLKASPNFISSSDFHLSYQISAGGAYIGIDKDIDGDSRCSLFPSIGADESTFPVNIPTAGYSVPDTLWQASNIQLFNAAGSGDNASHIWKLDGIELSRNLNLNYNFPDTGHFELRLITENCGGIDSFISTIFVSEVLTPPTAAFYTSIQDPEIFIEEVQFFDTSIRGASSRTWLITPHEYYDPQYMGYFPTYAWLNGNENSQNPIATFTKEGVYTICLIASNAVGSDTLCKTNHIAVKEAVSICNVSSNSALSGVLYDDGGVYSNYSSSLDCDLLINPCASELRLNVLEFDLKTSDVLRIYDGKDSLSGIPLWNSASYPNGMTGTLTSASVVKTPMVAKSGNVFVQFVTNSSTVGTGFRIAWSSIPLAASPIIANFTSTDTICEGNPTLFENSTVGQGLSFRWLIDGNTVSTQKNLNHEFTAIGIYKVELIAENCSGIDTFTKLVQVISPTSAPLPIIGKVKAQINLSENITLFDSTTYCISNRLWTITPNSFTFINGTNQASKNPQLKFTDTGCYSISLFVENSIGNTILNKPCLINVIHYCEPSITNLTTGIGISRVQLENLDNSSAIGSKALTDFTSLPPAQLVAGASHEIMISKNGSNNLISRTVWIDINQDGEFSSNEKLVSSVNSNSLVWKASLQIPLTAKQGLTRMRIGSSFGNLPLTACGSHAFGEFEDYAVLISPDLQSPVLTLIGNDTIWLEKGFIYSELGAKAIDNVDGDISASVQISGSVNNQVEADYLLTYSISDQAGNSAISLQRLVLVTSDLTAPALNLIGANPLSLPVYTSYSELGASALDQLDGDISAQVQITGTVDTAVVGNYILTYTSTDQAGNISTVNREVRVFDSIVPEIVLSGSDSVYIEVFNNYIEAGYNATDNYDATPFTDMQGQVNNNRIGTYFISYCATDNSGNKACVQRKIVVGDTTRPILSLLGSVPDTVDRWAVYNDPGFDVLDNYDPLCAVIIGGDLQNTISVGDFTITYVAVDQSGNRSDTLQRRVFVVENPLGIQKPQQEIAQIFPNPSTDIFNIALAVQSNQMNISILNSIGKEILQLHNGATNGTETLQFNLSGYAPGLYLVAMEWEGQRTVFKVVLR